MDELLATLEFFLHEVEENVGINDQDGDSDFSSDEDEDYENFLATDSNKDV